MLIHIEAQLEKLLVDVRALVHEDKIPASDRYKTLGDAVKKRRTELMLSLHDTANIAGVSHAHIWEIEMDNIVNPSVGMIYRLSIALNLPFLELCSLALRNVIGQVVQKGSIKFKRPRNARRDKTIQQRVEADRELKFAEREPCPENPPSPHPTQDRASSPKVP